GASRPILAQAATHPWRRPCWHDLVLRRLPAGFRSLRFDRRKARRRALIPDFPLGLHLKPGGPVPQSGQDAGGYFRSSWPGVAMRFRHVIMLALAALLLVAGTLAVAQRVQAAGTCLFGSCDPSGAKERMFGPRLGDGDVTKQGYESWRDNYEQ